MGKMRKLLSTILALVTGVGTVFGLVACGEEHTHTFGEWTRASDSTNCAEATFQRTCAECDHIDERKGAYEDHAWSASYSYNDTHHWFACDICGEVKDEDAHVDNGVNICRICDNLLPTASVTYELSSDGTYAIVTGYGNSETDSVIIASTYNGVPVKAIGDAAFEGCDSLAFITLPDSITSIGTSAFNGCERLMGILLHDSVTEVGDTAFDGCGELTIFCEAESKPAGWSESWNTECYTFWGYKEDRGDSVSPKTTKIGDSMLREVDSGNAQIIENADLEGVRAPEGFTSLTRYDSKIEDTSRPWTSGVLYHYNFDAMNLKNYSEIWFAAKLTNAFWAFVEGGKNTSITSPWVYFHITQTGKDEDGYILWEIEASIGGQVYQRIENQTGKALDESRPVNSIARLLWDEGFGSVDGNAILIYPLNPNADKKITIYCTEVRGVTTGEY